MARIVIESWVIQSPVAGAVSCVLQWMVGLKRLGHEVYAVEKAPRQGCSCNVATGTSSDDCSYGTAVTERALSRYGLSGHWCFVDYSGNYHGLSRREISPVLDSADLYIDMGLAGGWFEEASRCGMRVPVACGPGRTQVWATAMQWQAHRDFEYDGKRYGQKDMEFLKFVGMPGAVEAPLEVAVSGNVPHAMLSQAGWKIRNADEVSFSFDSYLDYSAGSRGEFSVAKNTFVAFRTAWFSERSALYLACVRPVVLQYTGFSRHLPCGEGLVAVNNVGEAAEALRRIESDWERQSLAARRIAVECLDSGVVLPKILDEIGLSRQDTNVQGWACSPA